MKTGLSNAVKACFDELDDPRIERRKLHPLPEILLVVLCGSICRGKPFLMEQPWGWSPLQQIAKTGTTLQRSRAGS
jgi:hypothetical protein